MRNTHTTNAKAETMNAATVRARVFEEVAARPGGIESDAINAWVFGGKNEVTAREWKRNMRRVANALGQLRRRGKVDRIFPEAASPWIPKG